MEDAPGSTTLKLIYYHRGLTLPIVLTTRTSKGTRNTRRSSARNMPSKDSQQPPLDPSAIPHTRQEPRPDFSQPPPHKNLPSSIQQTLDNEEKFWDTYYGGQGADSTDTSTRYAAYAARARTILRSAHRYVAYTSDVGESFRPVAHPYLVRGAYAVSWLYLGGDVAHEGYKAWCRNQAVLHPLEKPAKDVKGAIAAKESEVKEVASNVADATKGLVQPTPGRIAPIDDYRTVMAERAVFQSIASMGLPAFTIHTTVKYSGRFLKNSKNVRIRTWGPIGLGLAIVPALPFLFDEPVEKAVNYGFHKGFEALGGSEAVEGGAHAESKKEL